MGDQTSGAKISEIRKTGTTLYSHKAMKKHFHGDLPSLVTEAFFVAIDFHNGQKRRSSKLPYVIHPAHVACLVKKHAPQSSDELIAACLLHDTVEDTNLTLDELESRFGLVVAEIVDGVTKRDYESDLPKLEVKQKEGIRIGDCRAECHTLKCADIVSNISSMKIDEPERAKSYLKECKAVYMHLTKADAALSRLAAGELYELTWQHKP